MEADYRPLRSYVHRTIIDELATQWTLSGDSASSYPGKKITTIVERAARAGE